jgi:hypothetical protein
MSLTRRNVFSALAVLAATASDLAAAPGSDPKLDRAARAALRKLMSELDFGHSRGIASQAA